MYIVHKQEWQPQKIDSQICRRIPEHILRYLEKPQYPVVSDQSHRPQKHADDQEVNQCCGDSGLHLTGSPRAQKLRYNDCASDASAYGNCNKHIGDRIRCSDGSQRFFTDKFPHNNRIHYIIKLLKQIAQYHRQSKKQQAPSRMSCQHIIIFLCIYLFFYRHISVSRHIITLFAQIIRQFQCITEFLNLQRMTLSFISPLSTA